MFKGYDGRTVTIYSQALADAVHSRSSPIVFLSFFAATCHGKGSLEYPTGFQVLCVRGAIMMTGTIVEVLRS